LLFWGIFPKIIRSFLQNNFRFGGILEYFIDENNLLIIFKIIINFMVVNASLTLEFTGSIFAHFWSFLLFSAEIFFKKKSEKHSDEY